MASIEYSLRSSFCIWLVLLILYGRKMTCFSPPIVAACTTVAKGSSFPSASLIFHGCTPYIGNDDDHPMIYYDFAVCWLLIDVSTETYINMQRGYVYKRRHICKYVYTYVNIYIYTHICTQIIYVYVGMGPMGSKEKKTSGTTDFRSFLVLAIQLLGYPILTHTHTCM